MSVIDLVKPSRMLKDQDYMLKVFLGASLAIHLIVFILGHFNVFSFGDFNRPEWAIETELVAEMDFGGSTKTVLPNAKKSDKVAVPSNLLPQITKNFEVKEKKLKEEGLAPGKVDETLDEGKNPKDSDKDSITQDQERKAAARLKKREALKRLAMEKLRRQQKEKSNEYKAHESDLMPKLKEALNKDVGIGSSFGGGLVSGAETQRYLRYLKKAVRRNYSLPKTYQLKSAKIVASLHITLNSRGELVSAKVSKASGDSVFDQYCLEAVKKSAPFKSPPKNRAGEVLQLNCNP